MNDTSGVGVLDKAVSVLAAAESGPATLAQLVDATGLARPTAHRIAVALERHRLLARDVQGRFVLGPRIAELASAAGEDRLLAVAQPVLIQLRDATGESAQLYRRQADVRVCVAAAERASGLRDTVPVGAALPMTAGSAAQVLLAWEEGERMHRGLRGAKFTATTLAGVRRRGWAASAAEREAGVASVSAPGARRRAGRAAGCSPRSPCPGRSSGSPGRPGGCTRPRWSRRARRSASCCGPSWAAAEPRTAAKSRCGRGLGRPRHRRDAELARGAHGPFEMMGLICLGILDSRLARLRITTSKSGLDQVQKPTNFTYHIKTFVIMGPGSYRFRITRLSLE